MSAGNRIRFPCAARNLLTSQMVDAVGKPFVGADNCRVSMRIPHDYEPSLTNPVMPMVPVYAAERDRIATPLLPVPDETAAMTISEPGLQIHR